MSDATSACAGSKNRRYIWLFSILLFAAGTLYTLFFRYPGLDQSYLLLTAWEFVAGKKLYVDIYDLTPSAFLHSIPVLLHLWLDWSLVFSWNVFSLLLSVLSGLLYSKLVADPKFRWLGLIWAAILLLAFDALFILLIDLPLFVILRRATAFWPFAAMIVSGIVQVVLFFIFISIDDFRQATELIDYYHTVGFNYLATLRYCFESINIWLVFLFLGIFWRFRHPCNGRAIFVVLCLATGGVGLLLMIIQGQPRPIYTIPTAVSIISAALALLQNIFLDKRNGTNAIPAWHIKICAMACMAIPVIYSVSFCGLLVGLGRKYILQNDRVENVGRPNHDLFYDWVRTRLPDDENIAVIALEPGYPALDPVLSLVRLQRRSFSRMPALQFYLRSAILSGKRESIDHAIDLAISDIESSNASWLIIRRGGPGAPLQDVVMSLHNQPKFADWRRANFQTFETVGQYEVYRVTKPRKN